MPLVLVFCCPYYLCFVLPGYKIIVSGYMALETKDGTSGIDSKYLDAPAGETLDNKSTSRLICIFSDLANTTCFQHSHFLHFAFVKPLLR